MQIKRGTMKENTKEDYVHHVYKVIFYSENHCSDELSPKEFATQLKAKQGPENLRTEIYVPIA